MEVIIATDLFEDLTETTTAAPTSTDTATTSFATIQEQVTRTASIFEKAADHFKHALPSLLMAILILVIGLLISKLISRLVSRTMRRSNIDGAARSFLVSLVRIILSSVVIIMALTVINVPMSSIITIFGAVGLAISLALQSCLSNLAGGFIILFSKPFSAGDTIEIDNSVGKVESISILYTRIITFDNKTVFIPNGRVADAKIVNYTDNPTRRIDLRYDISYSADFNKAREAILDVIAHEPLILKDKLPVVRMASHNESSISIDVLVWVKNEDYIAEKYNMNEAVKARLDAENIEIPFNQLDVHIKDNT